MPFSSLSYNRRTTRPTQKSPPQHKKLMLSVALFNLHVLLLAGIRLQHAVGLRFLPSHLLPTAHCATQSFLVLTTRASSTPAKPNQALKRIANWLGPSAQPAALQPFAAAFPSPECRDITNSFSAWHWPYCGDLTPSTQQASNG